MRSGTLTHCNTLKQQPRGCLLARFTGAPRQGIHNAVLRRARNEHARRSRYAIVYLTASGVKYSNCLCTDTMPLRGRRERKRNKAKQIYTHTKHNRGKNTELSWMGFKLTHSRVLVWRSPCTVQCAYTTTHTEYVSAHHGGEASPLAHHEHVLVLGLRHVSRGQRSQTHQLIQTCTQRENVCLHHQIEKRNRYIIYIRSFGQLISSCIYVLQLYTAVELYM